VADGHASPRCRRPSRPPGGPGGGGWGFRISDFLRVSGLRISAFRGSGTGLMLSALSPGFGGGGRLVQEEELLMPGPAHQGKRAPGE